MPENLSSVKQRLMDLNIDIEFHGIEEAGKLVIVLESEGKKGIMNSIDQINATEGVLNSALVYHQIAEASELDEAAELPDDFVFPEHIINEHSSNNPNPTESVDTHSAGGPL
jgi:nitrate reductase NapD